MSTPIRCGTEAAYSRHIRQGEQACDACLKAHRAAWNAWLSRRVSNPKPGADCGTYAGFQRHHRYREPVCDACREAANAYQRDLRARKAATR